jgi:putative peptidoglycan lipid II flippase
LAAVLFNYGAASAEQASQLGVVIQIFMVGLLPFTLFYVLQRGWYANEDTRTPFFFSILMNGVLVVLAVLLFQQAGAGAPQVNALAAAYSIASLVTFVVSWPVLRRSYGFLDSRTTLWALLRIAVATVVALAAGLVVPRYAGGDFALGDSKLTALISIVVISFVVAVAYGVTAWLLRISEMRELSGWVTGAARRVLPSR